MIFGYDVFFVVDEDVVVHYYFLKGAIVRYYGGEWSCFLRGDDAWPCFC